MLPRRRSSENLMANSTMLQLITQATTEMGITIPTSVAGSTVQDTVQQLGLLNAVGYQLQREYEWQQINKEYRFQTVYYTYTGDLATSSTTISNMSSVSSRNRMQLFAWSRTRQNSLPGAMRMPRPSIWTYRLVDLVGLSITRASMPG